MFRASLFSFYDWHFFLEHKRRMIHLLISFLFILCSMILMSTKWFLNILFLLSHVYCVGTAQSKILQYGGFPEEIWHFWVNYCSRIFSNSFVAVYLILISNTHLHYFWLIFLLYKGFHKILIKSFTSVSLFLNSCCCYRLLN